MARFFNPAVAMLAGALLAVTPATAAPQRIVSFNLCADQLVVALADPGQIVGLSPYAANPGLSIVADAARAFPVLGWQAEGTVALNPDLVLVGPSDRNATQRMLRRFGLPVEEVALVTDLAAARRQINDMAQRLGHPVRGAALVAKLDAAVDRLQAAAKLSHRTALIIERNGYAAGPASLAAALLQTAGLKPPAGAPAVFGGYVSLEQVLLLRPDLLVLKDPPQHATDQGALFLTHPALRGLYPPERRIALPSRYTHCGGPALIAALDYLTDVMARLATTR